MVAWSMGIWLARSWQRGAVRQASAPIVEARRSREVELQRDVQGMIGWLGGRSRTGAAKRPCLSWLAVGSRGEKKSVIEVMARGIMTC